MDNYSKSATPHTKAGKVHEDAPLTPTGVAARAVAREKGLSGAPTNFENAAAREMNKAEPNLYPPLSGELRTSGLTGRVNPNPGLTKFLESQGATVTPSPQFPNVICVKYKDQRFDMNVDGDSKATLLERGFDKVALDVWDGTRQPERPVVHPQVGEFSETAHELARVLGASLVSEAKGMLTLRKSDRTYTASTANGYQGALAEMQKQGI